MKKRKTEEALELPILNPMEQLFQSFNTALEQEAEQKEKIKHQVKRIDAIVRAASAQIQYIHTNHEDTQVLDKVADNFTPLKGIFAELQTLVTGENYFKFLGIWKYQVQQVVFISSLIEYMRTGTLVKIVEVEATLGLPGKTPQDPCAWAVELEDYLLGVSFLPSELSRMCLNAVIREDYAFPFKAARFVEDLFAGFRLLNLKNDFLRKRFDSIKYEEKKIQEILYDISIRKLNKTAGAAKAE